MEAYRQPTTDKSGLYSFRQSTSFQTSPVQNLVVRSRAADSALGG